MARRNYDEKEGTTNNKKRSSQNSRTNQRGKAGNKRRNSRSNCNDYDDSSNDSTSVGISSNNDFAWYNTIPEITRNAARFPFSRPLGTHFNFNAATAKGREIISKDPGRIGTQKVIPGIMAIHWTPTIGVSTSALSAVNVTSREIYSFVRHANSGATNYDAPDLMIYLLAMDSIYSMYTAACRAYGLMMMYTKENRYMPTKLIEALGFDYNELKGNLAQFRWAINQIAYKISSFAVPNFMSYYIRHMWMNSGVYTDKPSAKAQMYIFVQDDVFKYDDKIQSTSFGGLTSVNISDVTYNVDTWLEMMDSLINPLLASEDMGIMSGDILKAFGQTNLFTVAPIPDDFVLVPSYSPEVLSQIQNCVVVGRVATATYGTATIGDTEEYFTTDIVQCIDGENLEGYLYYNPVFRSAESADETFTDYATGMNVTAIDKLITSDADTPDEAFVMVSTRLVNTPSKIASVTINQGGASYMAFDENATCSTEVVTRIKLISMDDDFTIGTYGLYDDTRTEGEKDSMITGTIAALSKFDWNPTIPIVTLIDGSGAGTYMFKGYYQDTNNYTLMSTRDLHRLHEAALLSEFYVPQIGSAARKPIK